jgi:hypothetical protein
VFSDGTKGVLDSLVPPFTTTASYAQASNTAGRDEIAAKYTPAFTQQIDALWAAVNASTTGAFEMRLYDSSSTLLASVATDPNAIRQVGQVLAHVVPITPVTLTGGAVYRIAIIPTVAVNVSGYSVLYPDTAAFDIAPCGQNFFLSTRVDAGAWTDSTLERLLAGVRVSGVDIPSGGSGGMLYIPNLDGA